MVRVERLTDAAQQVVRYVSKGRRLDTELLADVTSLSPGELSAALREAVAAHILVADEDGWYRFRHALLREVVADDLLPGERSEVHLTLAHALERRAAERGEGAHLAAGIAHHYYAAGDQPAALAASVRAADAADKVHAHGEAAALSERALELWDRVPNAEEVAGIDYIELLRRTAFDKGAVDDLARKEHLLKKALKLMDHQTDPLRAADLMEGLARTQWTLNRSTDAMETAAHALDLLPDDKPTTEKARLLGWLSKARMLQGKYVAALEVASEAIEAGQDAGDTLAEARARNARGISLVGLGDVEAGLAELRKSLEIARERDNAQEMGSGYANLADALNAAGRTREALAAVEEGQRVLEERFRTDWLKTMVAEFMFQLGEWDGAESWMPSKERRQVGTSLMYIMLTRINMSLGRGEHATAREYLNVIGEYVAESSEPQFLGAWGTLSARLDLREGDIESARQAVDEALDRIEFCTEDASRIVRLSAVGVAIEADAAQRARDLGDDPGPALARAEIMLARVRAAAEGDRPVERGWLLTAEAHWSRAVGDAEPTLWAEAAEAWEALEWPYETAIARFHEAEAHLAAGDRNAASDAANTALAMARRIGARWLAGEIEGLCARARLQFDGVLSDTAAEEAEAESAAPADEEEPFGLTPRERQVLTLVSEGRTNREIGDTLYMAEKTASVHVSRILSKLGVRSRTEAAAVAHRLGLDAASGTGRPASGA
jgi:ATP/maltotriose-dependent transcriptional regulator MalT